MKIIRLEEEKQVLEQNIYVKKNKIYKMSLLAVHVIPVMQSCTRQLSYELCFGETTKMKHCASVSWISFFEKGGGSNLQVLL